MILNKTTLLLIAKTAGKPIVAVFNSAEERWYYYLVDTFTPANPGNHIYDTELVGRDLESLLGSISGFAHGTAAISDVDGVMTRIEELPLEKIAFTGLKWVKFQNW